MKIWRAENRESVATYSKSYKEAHVESYKAYQKEFDSRPATRFAATKSKCKRLKLDFDLDFKFYSELIAYVCYYCEGNLNKTGVGLDRVNNNLGYVKENVVPCCYSCNKLKSDSLSSEETIVAVRAITNLREGRG